MSSCIAHIRLQRPVVRPANGTRFAEFKSEFLGGSVRVGFEWFEADDHAYFPQAAGAELTQVWIGGLDMGQHLASLVSDILQAELREHLAGDLGRLASDAGSLQAELAL